MKIIYLLILAAVSTVGVSCNSRKPKPIKGPAAPKTPEPPPKDRPGADSDGDAVISATATVQTCQEGKAFHEDTRECKPCGEGFQYDAVLKICSKKT